MTTKLPPLPPGDVEVWSDHEQTGRPGDMRIIKRDYSRAMVEQIRRETVMACADICAHLATRSGEADECEDAILALLDPLQKLADLSREMGEEL